MTIFEVLSTVLPMAGASVLLPYAQKFLNWYIPKKFRHLFAAVLALVAALVWSLVIQGSWEIALLNFAVVYGTAQTFYQKILKKQ